VWRFNGDMKISLWMFFIEINLETWRSHHEDFHIDTFLNMEILVEIFIGDIGDMEKNYYFLFEMFKR
jgi:hypothetical protein